MEGCLKAADVNAEFGNVISSVANAGHGLNAKDPAFGAICDGSSHPLSGTYSTLAAAQVKYPFITSLSQQTDYAALKLMSNTALGPDGSEHGSSNPNLNIPMYIPQGTCNLGADTWHIAKASGMHLTGAAKTATQLVGSSIVLQFDGLWYSHLSDLSITTTSSSAITALDVDGNAAGAGTTFGVQGNSFENMIINGGGSVYAFAMCRQGGGNGQCSEQVYVNVHLQNASFALYYQNGFNAIDNQFFGGDLQNYTTNGIYLIAGSLKIYGTSFESLSGYTQISNGGYDISAQAAGTEDSILVYGVRSESLRFYLGAFSQFADIRGFTHRPAALQTWTASTAYGLNTLVSGTDSSSVAHAFRVTTAGTSGGTVPTWPSSGTVTDGSVTWTLLQYNVVNIAQGNLDLATSFLDPTADYVPGTAPAISACGTSPSMGTNATQVRGTFTEGTSGTGCKIDFSTFAYRFPSACAVVPQASVTGFNFHTYMGGFILTNSALGAPVTFTYVCDQ